MLHFIKKIRFHRDTRLRSCQSCFNSPEVDEAIEEIEKHLDKLAAEQQKPAPISQEYLDSKLDELKSCIELSPKEDQPNEPARN